MCLGLIANFSSATCRIVGIKCIQLVISKNFGMGELRKVQALCSTDETNQACLPVGLKRLTCTLKHIIYISVYMYMNIYIYMCIYIERYRSVRSCARMWFGVLCVGWAWTAPPLRVSVDGWLRDMHAHATHTHRHAHVRREHCISLFVDVPG